MLGVLRKNMTHMTYLFKWLMGFTHIFGLTRETSPLKNSRLKVFLNLFEPPRTTLILCDNQTWQWEIRHGHRRLKGHHTLRIFHCHMKETGEALETVAAFRPLVASWLVVQ